MRLWHQSLIRLLPKQQLMGQHRECCALRGAGWNKKHSTVDYALKGTFEQLIAYHMLVIGECAIRGINIAVEWQDFKYRGSTLEEHKTIDSDKIIRLICKANKGIKVYSAHDKAYLNECLDNLEEKGKLDEIIQAAEELLNV